MQSGPWKERGRQTGPDAFLGQGEKNGDSMSGQTDPAGTESVPGQTERALKLPLTGSCNSLFISRGTIFRSIQGTGSISFRHPVPLQLLGTRMRSCLMQ